MAKVAVAVLGDVVLDRYLSGSTSRVSREAPIPVVVCESESDNLGGAGNVAVNLRGLGCHVFMAGFAGDDFYADRIRSHIKANDVTAELIIRKIPTLAKTRLLCGGQQIARFDNEKVAWLEEPLISHIIEFLQYALKEGAGAVVLSDYGLGFCTPALCKGVIALARSYCIPVFVDPRGSDWSKYHGACAITPNLSELASVNGASFPNTDEAVEQAARKIIRTYGLDSLLVTRSSLGMSLIDNKNTAHIPARPVEVFDVSGAGDTVIASLAAFAAAGYDLETSARLANEAAQFVVTKTGTYPISAEELLNETEKNYTLLHRHGIASRAEAASLSKLWKSEKRKVIFTNGCFDVLHAGHLDSLERARALGDYLIVGLNSDASVKRLKGETRPVNSERNRAALLAALRPVDLVVIFDEDTPRELLSEIKPDVLVKGGDYNADELPGREFADEVVIMPLIEGLSTTNILKLSS